MLLFLWELPVENVYKEQQLIPWSPPSRGCIKVNTDSATMGNPDLAAAWGFLRNSEGRWLFEFNAYLGFCSSLHAELRVVYYGLRFAWEKVIGGWWWRRWILQLLQQQLLIVVRRGFWWMLSFTS